MISKYPISDKGAKICIIENRYSVDELTAALGSIALYQDDLNRIKNESRKRDFLAIRLALKQLLGDEIKQIVYTDDGKPMLADESYKISFSHCKACVAVIIHPKLEVGIDVEVPSQKLETIHTRFLGSEELEFYQKEHSFEFLRVAWSAKEALYKIIGETAYNFAEQLRIIPQKIKEQGGIQVIHTDSGKEFSVKYTLTPSYTLAYSVEDE